MYAEAKWNTCMRVGKCLRGGSETNMRRGEWKWMRKRESTQRKKEMEKNFSMSNKMSNKKEGNAGRIEYKG